MKRLRDRECRNRSSYDPFRVIRLPTRRFRGRCPRLLTPALPGQRALDTDFSPGTRSGSEDERGKGSRKTQNNGNKAKKLLKTKDLKFCKVQKRTENELKFECQMRGLDSKSGFGTSPNPVIPGEGGMILRLTTAHENGLVGVKPCVFNKSSGHFQGSRSCPSADGHPETMKTDDSRRMWRGRLARGRGSVPLPRAGRMPARQRAGRPRHDSKRARNLALALCSAKHLGRAGFLALLAMTEPKETRNRGSKAKKLLKTKDVTYYPEFVD